MYRLVFRHPAAGTMERALGLDPRLARGRTRLVLMCPYDTLENDMMICISMQARARLGLGRPDSGKQCNLSDGQCAEILFPIFYR